MSQKPGFNGKKFAIILSSAFLVITFMMGFLAYLFGVFTNDEKKTTSVSQDESINDVSASSEISENSGGTMSDSSISESSSSQIEENTSSDIEEDVAEEPVSFNMPDEMRAVEICAGRDFLLSESDMTKSTLTSQMDKAIANAQELTMNTVIIDTKYKDDVLFQNLGLSAVPTDIDCVEYLATKAKEAGMYVYATYDVSALADDEGKYYRANSLNGDILDSVAVCAGEFAEKYRLDGILLDNYYVKADAASYSKYVSEGAGAGYENYLRQIPSTLLHIAAESIRQKSPGTQVGLLAEAVWENSTKNPDGTQTKATFTAQSDGYADTRAFVQDKMFDFVMVKNFGSTNEDVARFGVVAEWWAKLTQPMGIPLYIMHASDRAVTQSVGWNVPEQLTKQVIDLSKINGISGSAFNSLKALLANPSNSTTTLIKYMNDEINEQYVLTQLNVSKPHDLTFTTKEQTVTFQGASDPQEDVKLNGEKIPTNDSGYFSIREDLKAGLNTFEIEHKGKKLTYEITRQVEVLKEVSPVGAMNVEGGTQVTITALAYENATVTASIGGQTITLSLSDNEDDAIDRESGYKLYAGIFTAPAASASATNVGTISVTATAQGVTKTMQGASVTVNKIVQMGEGAIVQVTAAQAETFPVNTLNNTSSSSYYPLPQGTLDMTCGNEIVYKDGKNTFKFWTLQSGVRVRSEDINAVGSPLPDNNQISKMSIKSGAQYTTVSLTTRDKVPYLVSYDGTKIVFQFKYTASVPESQTLTNNALFSAATWEGSNLALVLRKSGGFMGYSSYYDGDVLNLRFNNSPGSLSGTRIMVDPGHGGNDPGAPGFYPGKDEADINIAVSQKLVSELKSRGADVLMTAPGSTMAVRLSAARSFNAQVLVSVHCNSAPNSAATGTEVYYFYPFQKQLAAYLSANIADSIGTANRGAKSGLFYMTRESQMACALAEIGFVSNEGEYSKLINSKYQTRIAQGIANGITGYLGGVNSGGGTGGTDDMDNNPTPETSSPDESSSTNETSSNEEISSSEAALEESSNQNAEDLAVESISLNKTELTMRIGETETLKVKVKPANATNNSVTWASNDEEVVKINSSGKLTAKSEGSATITVTAKDGGYEEYCDVTVDKNTSTSDKSGLVEKITITGENSIDVGTRITLAAEVFPSDAKDIGVKWSISDTSIANFSGDQTESSCRVEGIRNGTVTLTAQAYDEGKVIGTFKLKIGTGKSSASSSSSSDSNESTEKKKGVIVESVSISGPSNIERGTRVEYEGTVSPANAEDPGIKWTIEGSDGIIAIYKNPDNENIIKVEGVKKGTAYLVGTAYDKGGAIQKMKITVV